MYCIQLAGAHISVVNNLKLTPALIPVICTSSITSHSAALHQSHTMSTTPSPRGEATDLDPRLSYLLSSQHHSVSRLLNLSLTEIIHPAPPKLPNIPTTNSTTSLSTDQDLAVKDSQDFVVKDSLVAHEPRCLLTSTSCSCLPAQQFKQTNGPIAGWDRNESVPLSHFVASVKSPSEPTKNGSSLPKSSSTGKIETSRVFRGYPYEKTDIPFHFQHLDEDDPAADYAEMYRVAFTYPNLEDKLRSSSISDYTSYSAPSVIEPKLLMFGVSKPGVAKPHRPAYIKQVSSSNKYQQSCEVKKKKT